MSRQEGKPEKVEKVATGLKSWIIAYSLLFPPIAFFFNNWMQSLGRWWLWPAILPLPMIWYLILFHALRLKISPQEMTLFTIVNFITGGSMYVAYGLHYWTSVPLITWNYAMFIHGKIVDPYKDVFRSVFPSFLAPNAESQLNAFYYGGAFDFGVWAPSMIFWMAWAIALFGGGILWSFALRKPLIEVERLPFPGIMPTVVLIREYYESGASGRPRLFDFSELSTKVLWIGFIIGCIMSVPIIVNAFLPSPWIWYIHQYEVNLIPITEGAFPGATFAGAVYVTDVFVGQFIPLDMLATAVLWWFLCGVVYQTIGVRLGVLPYTPGSTGTEFAWDTGPFKWMRFSHYLSVGLGVWLIINYRHHIANIIKSGLGFSTGSQEEGVSYRLVVLGGILAYIAIVILMCLGGAYAPFAIVIPLFYILYMFGWVRMMGEAQEFMPSVPFYQLPAYDVGQALGGWGSRPDPAALPSMMFYYSFGCGGARMSALAMHHFFKSYKLAYETRTPAKGVVVVGLLSIISTAVFGYITWPWWYSLVGGYSRSRAIEYHIWNLPGPWNLSYGTPPPISSAEEWGYMIGGIIFVMLVYTLRLRYTWFFINPVGMMALPHWWWPTWLIAFVIKYLVLKIGGARLHERYVIPFSAGFCAGYGAFVIVSAFIAFFTLAYPEFIARISAP